jgi:hypothetical protein
MMSYPIQTAIIHASHQVTVPCRGNKGNECIEDVICDMQMLHMPATGSHSSPTTEPFVVDVEIGL